MSTGQEVLVLLDQWSANIPMTRSIVKALQIALSFLVVFASSNGVKAGDIYVNNIAGSDANNGQAPRSRSNRVGPYRTLDRALRAVSPGDRIILANTEEPYREMVAIQGPRNDGFSSRPLVIEGNYAVLDGSARIPSQAWIHYRDDLYRFVPQLKSYQRLFLDGILLKQRHVDAVGRIPELKPLEWCLYDQSIIFRPERNRLPQTYNLSYGEKRVGITLYQVRHVEIRNLTVRGFQLDGINAHDRVYDVTLTGIVCHGNGRSGISIGGSSRVKLENCVLRGNGAAQMRTEAFGKAIVRDCEIVSKDAPAILRDGGSVTIETRSE